MTQPRHSDSPPLPAPATGDARLLLDVETAAIRAAQAGVDPEKIERRVKVALARIGEWA